MKYAARITRASGTVNLIDWTEPLLFLGHDHPLPRPARLLGEVIRYQQSDPVARFAVAVDYGRARGGEEILIADEYGRVLGGPTGGAAGGHLVNQTKE